jgi:hypothetical protein
MIKSLYINKQGFNSAPFKLKDVKKLYFNNLCRLNFAFNAIRNIKCYFCNDQFISDIYDGFGVISALQNPNSTSFSDTDTIPLEII